MPVFRAAGFLAAAVFLAGFLFAVDFFAGFLFAAAILHPSYRAGWLKVTLATSARRSARIAFETRTVADEGKVSAFSTCFPFITLNAGLGDKI